jgi:hypothetical protein
MATEKDRPQKTKPWSDIDLNRWRDYDHVLTDSLWNFPSRASGEGHTLDYHGNFIPQIANQTFTRYTKAGEVVLDMFLGSGTSAIEALNLGRRCIGVELKPDLVEYVRAKVPSERLDTDVYLIQGDSTDPATADGVRATLAAMGETHAHLLMLHPPYHDIIPFSGRAEDLSNAPDTCPTPRIPKPSSTCLRASPATATICWHPVASPCSSSAISTRRVSYFPSASGVWSALAGLVLRPRRLW